MGRLGCAWQVGLNQSRKEWVGPSWERVQQRRKEGVFWAVLSGGFGLLFGALCAPVDIFIGGFGYAVSKWISGIPFDLMHCAGNFAIALVLFKPLRKLTEKLYARI